LLDLYDKGDQQHSQIARAYDVARTRLAEMEKQRDELEAAISELREQMTWGERMLASLKTSQKAAE
jgi:predicted  nucleic acid-binding Zn-ribbon protein